MEHFRALATYCFPAGTNNFHWFQHYMIQFILLCSDRQCKLIFKHFLMPTGFPSWLENSCVCWAIQEEITWGCPTQISSSSVGWHQFPIVSLWNLPFCQHFLRITFTALSVQFCILDFALYVLLDNSQLLILLSAKLFWLIPRLNMLDCSLGLAA